LWQLVSSKRGIMADTKEIIEDHVTHFEDNGNFDRSWRDEQWGQKSLSSEAHEVAIDEKELGPWAAIQAYPKAILWSLVFSTCVIMEGYDTNLLGNFYAYRMCTQSFHDFPTLLI
jgi:hypothetical protein